MSGDSATSANHESTDAITSDTSPESEVPSSTYLGSTSYSAVFTEGQNHPKLQDLPDKESDEACLKCNIRPHVSRCKIEEGAETLALFLGLSRYRESLKTWLRIQCAMSAFPFMLDCIEDVCVRKPESKAALLSQSERVFLNSSRPLNLKSSTTVQEFTLMLLGDSLRWDFVGLMLVAAGSSAMIHDEVNLDPTGETSRRIDYKAEAEQLLEASDRCIANCESMGQITDITVWLIMLNYILHTQVHGDAGKYRRFPLGRTILNRFAVDNLCWRKLGGQILVPFLSALRLRPLMQP